MLSFGPYIKSNNLILASPRSGTSGEFLRSLNAFFAPRQHRRRRSARRRW